MSYTRLASLLESSTTRRLHTWRQNQPANATQLKGSLLTPGPFAGTLLTPAALLRVPVVVALLAAPLLQA
jgi:hypothetical protein